MTKALKELWDECVEIIRDNISPKQFDTWFACIEPQSFDHQQLVIAVPSRFVFEHLETTYIDLIYKVITRVFGKGVQLSYTINEIAGKKNISKPSNGNDTIQPSVKGTRKEPVIDVMSQATPADDLDSRLNANYTFASFIEGESNRLARSVGEAIAKNPAQTFNPLFIYGPSGCGKTHLINAIGWGIKQYHPQLRVIYLSAHLFQVQYTTAVRQNKVNDFIAFYQTIDALLIDDVQELSGKTNTQNTFFHIFNHLHLNHKQIILTADRPPIDIVGLEERLLTRFKWGLQAEIFKPTKALCRAILNYKVKQDALPIPANVINYIAEKVNGSVRDLEGILNSLMAHAVVYKCEINMRLADQVLPRYIKVDTRPLTIADVKQGVCKHYNVHETELCSQSRRQPINQIRQTAAYLASILTELSNIQIGDQLGGRSHATILHAIRHIKEMAEVDAAFQKELDDLAEEIKRNR